MCWRTQNINFPSYRPSFFSVFFFKARLPLKYIFRFSSRWRLPLEIIHCSVHSSVAFGCTEGQSWCQIIIIVSFFPSHLQETEERKSKPKHCVLFPQSLKAIAVWRSVEPDSLSWPNKPMVFFFFFPTHVSTFILQNGSAELGDNLQPGDWARCH